MYENEVTIIGNLTRKPELKSFATGQLTSLSIAVNKVWTDRNTNEKKESVEYISVTVFGKQAGNCVQYLEKGQKVYVKGFIKNRVEDTQDGKRYHTGVVAERVQFGPATSPSATKGAKTSPRGKESQKPSAYDSMGEAKKDDSTDISEIEYPQDDIHTEDIPF